MQPEIDVMIETEDGWARGTPRYSIIDQGCLDAVGLTIAEVQKYFARLIDDGAMLPDETVRFHYSDDGHYADTTAAGFAS